jgi:hypothetical protein
MSRPLQLTQWQQQLASRFPEMPATTVFVLALYSFGMLLARVSGLSTVVLTLAKHLGWPSHPLRKRLREFYLDAAAKSGFKQGVKRKDLDVAACFAPLLGWLLSLWSGRHLALAIDVTNLGERFHVLAVSVVVRGVGIPVAWKVLPGGAPEAWNPHWQALLRRLRPAVPAGWVVLVLSDRGLESPELFRFICGLGWHPLMRVKKGGKFRPAGWGKFYGLGELVRQVGGHFYAEGTAYAGAKLPCTLLACWGEGHAEPWLLLTDLPPEAGSAVWYALRAWIEQGFKAIKGGGWDWQKTRMEDPGRVERLWLVLAVATLWLVALGAEDEAREEIEAELKRAGKGLAESCQEAQARQERERQRLERQKAARQERQARRERQRQAREQRRQARKAAKKASKAAGGQEEAAASAAAARPAQAGGKRAQGGEQRRQHRLDRRGLAVLGALWARGQNRLPQHLHPEPWPQPCHPASTLTEQDFLSQPK